MAALAGGAGGVPREGRLECAAQFAVQVGHQLVLRLIGPQRQATPKASRDTTGEAAKGGFSGALVGSASVY